MEEKVVAIDFDGVIVEYDGWHGKKHVGDVRWENHPRENLKRLQEEGIRVMIYTCRSHHDPVVEVLSENNIPYDWINCNPLQPESVSKHKIWATWYIDDRTPTFQDLTHSVSLILEEIEEEKKREERAEQEQMSIEKLREGEYLVKDRYVVDIENESCTCPDYEFRDVKCKHLQYVEKEVED